MATLFQWEQPGHVRPVNEEGTKPAGDCFEENDLIAMGSGITDGSGHWTLELRPVLCIPAGIFEDPSIVATPTFPEEVRASAVFITTEWNRPAPGSLFLGARSWDADGNPAKNIPFSWHLRVRSIFVTAETKGA
jgi:hypothetical protein